MADTQGSFVTMLVAMHLALLTSQITLFHTAEAA
jgi:hypothetical protein